MVEQCGLILVFLLTRVKCPDLCCFSRCFGKSHASFCWPLSSVSSSWDWLLVRGLLCFFLFPLLSLFEYSIYVRNSLFKFCFHLKCVSILSNICIFLLLFRSPGEQVQHKARVGDNRRVGSGIFHYTGKEGCQKYKY